MNFQRFVLLLSLTAFCFFRLQAQDTESDEGVTKKRISGKDIFTVQLTGNYDFPAADMAKRFGNNYRLGVGLLYKQANQFCWGVKGELLFGNVIREDSLMINLKTSQNGVIAQVGDVLNPATFERGYLIGIQAGRLFPLSRTNPNSGILSTLGIGFMQHKIKLFDKDQSFPQLRDEYVKGYDRLSNGLYLEHFTGYMYFSKNKLINCMMGLNIVCAFTKGRRDFLYDVARSDTRSRTDLLVGLKLGWIIPMYKKVSEETYY